MSEILAEVIRSGLTESIHRGDIVVVDSDGKILYKCGNTRKLTFFRSSGKPFIALACLETGIAEEYNLDLRDIALMSSSHSGDTEHIEALQRLLIKTGLKEEQLKCGVQIPTGRNAARKLSISGRQPTQLHCNCSGKHIGVMAASQLKSIDIESYVDPKHPVQDIINRVISDFCGIKIQNIKKGTDGCGITVYGMPLINIAKAYANLCNDRFLQGKYAKSQNYIISAMSMHPEMVAGESRVETEVMKLYGDKVIAKSGAEGMFCAGIPGKGIGIAIKIEDGNIRAEDPVFIEVLHQMGILSHDEVQAVSDFHSPKIKTHSGQVVGYIRPVFTLKNKD